MGKGNRNCEVEPKSAEVKKLKGVIRNLEHEITRLKSELKTYSRAFSANVTFLKSKTKNFSVEELIQGVEAEMTLEEIGKDRTNTMQAMTDRWKCFKCDEGVLKLIIVPNDRYFRKCSQCTHRTEIQPYNEDVVV